MLIFEWDLFSRWTALLVTSFILAAARSEDNWLRRRIPISVRSPEYIRLSSDPHVLEHERIVARSKGVNICVKRIKKIENHATLCSLNPRKCPRLDGFKHAAAMLPLFYTKYECCPGYEAVKYMKGCPKDKFSSKYNIIQVAKQLGLSTFVYLIRKTMLYLTLRYWRPLTVLIPTNEVFANFFETKKGASMLRNEYSLRILLAMHVFGGKWPTVLLRKRNKLESFLPGEARVANILVYGRQLLIQNTLVIKKDLPASNGIIHVVDTIIQPSLGTVQSILRRHKGVSIFSKGLESVNFEISGYNTLFIPSNDAFKRAGITTQKALQQHFKCLKEFLATHLVPGIFFPVILKLRPRIFVRNLAKSRLNLLYRRRKFYINKLLVKAKYFAATNGVIFVIDQLLVTPRALHIYKVLQKFPSVSWVAKMMNQTDFESKFLLGNQTYTLFLPSNLAVKQMGRKQQEGFEQDESTIGFLMDHVADKKYLTQRLTNDMAIYSLKNQPIRVNKRYISEFCIQGSKMSPRLRNIEACNAAIHVINSQPIRHSKKSILDIITSDSRLLLLSMALNFTNLKRTLDSKSPITFFAPSNEAWQKLDNKTLVDYFGNEQQLTDVLEYHTIFGTFYSCNLSRRKSSPFSIAGRRVRLSLKNFYSDKIIFNYAETIASNIVAKNGVVHIVDNVVQYLYKRKYFG